MAFATNDGVKVHYEIEGHGEPLVLQHGFTQSMLSWHLAGYVSVLRQQYRLVLVDARGHGQSDKLYDPEAYTLQQHVADVVAVLDAVGVARGHFWGYSMGGWIGFGMAKHARERLNALIIGGQHPYERKVPPDLKLDGSDPVAFLRALGRRLGLDYDALPPERRQLALANDFRALAVAQQDRPSLEPILPSMTMPCLLYAGEADVVFERARQCVKEMPRARFVSFPGLDHAAMFQSAETVLPHIVAFLRAREATAASR